MFDDWSAYGDKYEKTSEKLRALKSINDNIVLITNKEGSRGINFNLKFTAMVVIAFTPRVLSDVTQAVGRGSRSFSK